MSEGTLSTKAHLKEYRKTAPQTLKHRCIPGHSTSYWLQDIFCRQILRGKHLRKPAISRDTFFSREQDAVNCQLPKDACWRAPPDNKVYAGNRNKHTGHWKLSVQDTQVSSPLWWSTEQGPERPNTQTAPNLGGMCSESILKTVIFPLWILINYFMQ